MERVIVSCKRLHTSFATLANRRLKKALLTTWRVELLACHRVLFARHGVVHQCELAAFMGIHRTTLSVMLRRMEKRGLIERRSSTGDRRRRVVVVTPAGYAAFATVEPLLHHGVVQSVIDTNLRLVDFSEPLPIKRARLLRYLDTLRSQFAYLSPIVYPAAPQPLTPTEFLIAA